MKRIIIVEDDASILDTMILILRNTGYSVTSYFDGERILENDFELPDLFLIDKQLSGVDGLDICRYLKTQEPTKNIPVIIVSASPNIKNQAKEAMSDDVLEKPFKMKALRDIVANQLSK